MQRYGKRRRSIIKKVLKVENENYNFGIVL